MNDKFGELTQPVIKTKLYKNTSVVALIMFHETRGEKPKKYFMVLICVIYNIIKNYVCIDYLAFQSKDLSKTTVGSRNDFKNRNIGYWNSIFVNEPIVVSWFFEEHKFCCHIKMS